MKFWKNPEQFIQGANLKFCLNKLMSTEKLAKLQEKVIITWMQASISPPGQYSNVKFKVLKINLSLK